MTQPTFFVEEDRIVSALFREGLDLLHLYKPGAEPMYSERFLTLIPESFLEDVMVHENFYLKTEYGLKGIHYDDPASAPAKLPRGKSSATCRNIEDLKSMKKKFDYVFLRNIYDCQSEDAEKQSFSIEELEFAASEKLIDKHVYALGGMNEHTVRTAKDLGFGGVVICGDLWNRFKVHTEQDYKHLLLHFERLKKLVD